jgi:hypothetical protein
MHNNLVVTTSPSLNVTKFKQKTSHKVVAIPLKQKMLAPKLAIKLKVHNWLLPKLINMGPIVAKKHKCTNLLLPCPSLTIANPNKKMLHTSLMLNISKCRNLLLPQLKSMGLIVAKLQTCNKKQVEKLVATPKFNCYKF